MAVKRKYRRRPFSKGSAELANWRLDRALRQRRRRHKFRNTSDLYLSTPSADTATPGLRRGRQYEQDQSESGMNSQVVASSGYGYGGGGGVGGAYQRQFVARDGATAVGGLYGAFSGYGGGGGGHCCKDDKLYELLAIGLSLFALVRALMIDPPVRRRRRRRRSEHDAVAGEDFDKPGFPQFLDKSKHSKMGNRE